MQIALIGMGLIGTSLGGALRAAPQPDPLLGSIQLVGYDTNPAETREARGRLAIDRVAGTLAEAVQGADLVVLATPVQAVRPLLAELAPLLAAGTVVTDVASTKAAIVAWAHELLPAGVPFVGGHPMAGKEQHGAKAADSRLLQGAIYCLTPGPATPQYAIERVEALVRTVGARAYFIDPHEHDSYVAGISHLPFLLSAALVEATSRSPAWREMAPLAASGFRDISRLASGDPVMHRDICLSNRAALTRWLNDTIGLLVEMREALDQDDAQASQQLGDLFAHAREVREAWLAQSNQPLRPGEEQLDTVQYVERRGLLSLFGFRLGWGRPKQRDQDQ